MGLPVVSFLFNIRPFISLDFAHLLIFWLTFPPICVHITNIWVQHSSALDCHLLEVLASIIPLAINS